MLTVSQTFFFSSSSFLLDSSFPSFGGVLREGGCGARVQQFFDIGFDPRSGRSHLFSLHAALRLCGCGEEMEWRVVRGGYRGEGNWGSGMEVLVDHCLTSTRKGREKCLLSCLEGLEVLLS